MNSSTTSEWYKKYYTGPDSRIGTLRSGFTPVKLAFPKPPFDPQSKRNARDQRTELFQKDELYGFTTQELIDLGAISDRKLKAPNLQNGVDKLFERRMWATHDQTKYRVPIKADFHKNALGLNDEGFWEASNDFVWDLMKPILVLATRMYVAAEPFFNSIIDSERISVEPSRIPLNLNSTQLAGLVKVRPKKYHPGENPVFEARKAKVLDKMAKYVRFGFMDGYHDPIVGDLNEDEEDVLAYTSYVALPKGEGLPDELDHVWSFLNIDTIQPLFRQDLTDAERLGHQYLVATTVIHELSHAFVKVTVMMAFEDQVGYMALISGVDPEPYYMDDPIAEAGFAMEKHVFGGIIGPMIATKRQPVQFGLWLETEYPTTFQAKTTNFNELLLSPALLTEVYSYPIPTNLFEDVQQESFWSNEVRAFGTNLHELRFIKKGAIHELDDGVFQDEISGHTFRSTPPDHWSLKLSQMESNKVESQQVQNALQLTPELKDIALLGRTVLEDAQLRHEYWEANFLQKQEISNILKSLKQFPYTNEDKTARNILIVTLIQPLARAVNAHEKHITAVFKMELSTKKVHGEDRDNLLTFNREAIHFIRQAQTVYNEIKGVRHTGLEDLEKKLEINWMRLYELELANFLNDWYNDWNQSRNLEAYNEWSTRFLKRLMRIEQPDNPSWFYNACVKLWSGALGPSLVPENQKLQEIGEAQQDFTEMSAYGLLSVTWKDVIGTLLLFAADKARGLSPNLEKRKLEEGEADREGEGGEGEPKAKRGKVDEPRDTEMDDRR